MAQANVLRRNRVTYIGEESAFGTAPSGAFPNAMTKTLVTDEEFGVKPRTEMLENADESLYRTEGRQPVHGLAIETEVGPIQWHLKATPSASQLTASGAAGSLTPRLLLRHAYGVEHAAIGTTVATGTSSTAFDVASAANLKKGTWIAVTISGTPEWTKITNVSGVTITVSPALSGTPIASAVVRNLYNYCPGDAGGHGNSLSIYRGWRSADGSDVTAEYILNGVYGDVTWTLPEYGKLPMLGLTARASVLTGPAASGSIDTATSVTDEMGAVIAWKPSIYLATSIARATRLVCESVSIERAPNTWHRVRDGGAASTIASVVNTAGRPNPVTLKVRTRFDSAWKTGFDADTGYDFAAVLTSGSGATMSFWILDVPNCKLVAEPEPVEQDGLFYMDLTLRGLQDDSVTAASETGADRDRIYAVERVAFG